MAISTVSLSERDFTREPWDTYPWPGFDSLANDLDIGRYSLPPVGEMSDQTAQYLWGASFRLPPRLASDTTGPSFRSTRGGYQAGSSPTYFGQMGRFLPLLQQVCGLRQRRVPYSPKSSAANKISLGRTGLQSLQAQLKSQGYRTTSRLPDGERVLLDEDFVGAYRSTG